MFNPESPPEITASRWFNAQVPPSLAGLRGKVVVMGAFQMACPGSARHLVPQLARVEAQFSTDEVAVIGLHSVFEQADKQTPEQLADFIRERALSFPVAVDEQGDGPLPETMDAYELQGTPTLLIFDRQGRLRRHYLGQVDDMRVAAEVMALTIEARDAPREQSIAIERRLAAVLVDPDAHHHGDGCGCGHDHGHDHDHDHSHSHGHHHHDHHHHDHDHSHAGGCCGGHHHHDHSHHDHDRKQPQVGGQGGCGNADCGCKG